MFVMRGGLMKRDWSLRGVVVSAAAGATGHRAEWHARRGRLSTTRTDVLSVRSGLRFQSRKVD